MRSQRPPISSCSACRVGWPPRSCPASWSGGVRVVDLSADYRYRSLALWQAVYSSEAVQFPRVDGALCEEAVYGLPEWEEARLGQARLVAAPGCFPTAGLLPLLPFLQQGLIETKGIIIDAKTGCSGGGRAAKEHLLLAEASEAVVPYGVVGHRHTSEIEQAASLAVGQPIQLQFTPHLMPMVRGLLATVYGRLRDPGLTAEDCTTLLRAAYRNSPCVEVLPVGTYPSTKWVRQTNRALLSVQVDKRTGQLILLCAIDNLVKGQAGQGVAVPQPDGRPAGGNRPAAAALLSLSLFPALSSQGDGQRQEPMFLALDALRQAAVAVTVQHRHSGLGQDRSAIDHLTNQVGGAARQGHPCRQGLADGVLPAEAGQQRRVNVQKPGWEGFDQPGGDDPHPARHHHQVDTGCGEGLDQGLIEILPLAIQAVIQADAVHSKPLGPPLGATARVVDHQQLHRRVQRSVPAAGYQRFEIGSMA